MFLNTYCGWCKADPCTGNTSRCNTTVFLQGNVTRPFYWGGSDDEYQLLRLNTLGIKPSAAIVINPDHFTYDADTGQWRLKTDVVPDTVRKCECGVWSTGGLHSDWCPCAGGDCVQKEDR